MSACPLCVHATSPSQAEELPEATTTVSLRDVRFRVCPNCAADLVIAGAKLDWQL